MNQFIFIAKESIGLPQNLAFDGEKFITDNDKDEKLWCWSNEDAANSLRHIALATDSKITSQPPKAHVTAWDELGITPPWSQALPPHVFKSWLQKFTRELLELRDRWADSYYGN